MDHFRPLAAGLQLGQEERVKFHRNNIIFHLEQLQEMKVLGLSTKDGVVATIDHGIESFLFSPPYHLAQAGHDITIISMPKQQVIHRGMLAPQPTLNKPKLNKLALNPLASNFQAPGHSKAHIKLEPKSPAQDFAQRAAKLNIRIASGAIPAPGQEDGEVPLEVSKRGEGLDPYLAEDDDLIDLFSPYTA